MISELNQKEAPIQDIALQAMQDDNILLEIINNLKVKQETIRYNSYKVLMKITEMNTERLYPYWDYFVEQIKGENTYWKCSGIHLITNLTKVDVAQKFERIFDQFYALLDDKSMIPAAYVAGVSGKIAKAKPHLQKKITEQLLNIENTHFAPDRRDLIKAGAIESFNEYFDEIENKQEIMDFVRGLQKCASPKTEKLAKEFVRNWQIKSG